MLPTPPPPLPPPLLLLLQLLLTVHDEDLLSLVDGLLSCTGAEVRVGRLKADGCGSESEPGFGDGGCCVNAAPGGGLGGASEGGLRVDGPPAD